MENGCFVAAFALHLKTFCSLLSDQDEVLLADISI